MSKLFVVKEFWQFVGYHKKYWLVPIVITLVLIGFLLVLAKTSVLSPFIYALF